MIFKVNTMSILKQIKKLIRGDRPWEHLEKNFKMRLTCDECGLETPALFTVSDSELNCAECKDAKKIHARMKRIEEEWDN